VRDQRVPAAPTVVANLTAPLLRMVAEGLTEPPRTLICSGLLPSEVDEVSAALGARGMRVTDHRARGDWRALLARSEARPERGASSPP
jgi:ribosomal protein L11 methylase PrmA